MNNFDALPELIREKCSFCCWRRENRNGRVTKVPYTPTSGSFARSNDVKTFRSFDKALTAYKNSQEHSRSYDGLGICVDGAIGAIDIDHCIDEAGNLNDVATAVLGAFNDCYFEVSPSGTGLRGFFEVSPDFRYDPSTYYIKNSAYGLEIYLPGYTSRFVTVTGNVFHSGPVSADMDALQVILDTFMLRGTTPDSSDEEDNSTTDPPHSYLTDEEVIEKGSASSNGALFSDLYAGRWQEHSDKYQSQSEVDMAFASMLAFWCGCDFEQMNRIFESSGLYREKWDREQSGSTYGALTLEKAIQDCRDTYKPFTSSTAAEDFEEVEGEDDPLSSEKDRILRMSETNAVSEFKTLLSEDLTKEQLFSDEVVALAARSFRMAPFLYEELRLKAKKMGVRVGTLDFLFDTMKAEMVSAEQAAKLKKAHDGKPVPDFIVYNSKRCCYEIDCPKLARHVRENLHYLLVQDGGMGALLKYVYDNGCYYACSDDRMKGYIKKFITDYDESLLHMNIVDEVFRQVTTDLDVVSSKALDQNEDIINFQNGILNLDTMVLQPHSPDILSTIQIPCNWNGTEAPTPVFDSFMNTLTGNRPEVEKLLLEFMGVCLSNVKGWRLKKALFLYGEGNTGKSQVKGLTEKLLGMDNFIGIDLDKIEARFGTSAIYRKRLAGSSDMKFMTIRELETFKQCTGGDALFAEFKGLPAFHFVYDGLLWFCTNRAPKFGGDQGDWVYDRMILIDCNNVIPIEKRDRHIIDKMYSEREGIMYKVVMALKQVIDNGYRFDEPEAITENRHTYKLQNNSVLHFFEECMQERPKPGTVPLNDKFTVNRVFKIYLEWCDCESDGYKCKFSEFKNTYSSYCGKPLEECIGSRNGGNYLLYHRLLPDIHEGYWRFSEPAFAA